MSKIILLNKPFHVLSQFQDNEGRQTLKDFLPNETTVYPAGRLDYDSEGLLVLTDDGTLQHSISHPSHKLPKTYWVQVEGTVGPSALKQLASGVLLKDGITAPARVKTLSPPTLWARTPPIRQRTNIPTQWLALTITEGRNRQVRRMTAAIGHPTLRLIRVAIGSWQLGDLQPGQYQEHIVHSPLPKKQARKGSTKKGTAKKGHSHKGADRNRRGRYNGSL